MEYKWIKKKNSLEKFFKLKNKQWLKILFSYSDKNNIWFATIVVANTRRKCNDCLRKTENSPKVFYGKQTGRKLGLEAFKIALKELLQFENVVENTEIRIIGANERLNNVYKYLYRYGYIEQKNIKNKKENYMFKII